MEGLRWIGGGEFQAAARVTQTDGSVENLEILKRDQPALAIVQYDVALASFWSDRIYGTTKLKIPTVQGLRRIARPIPESASIV